MSLDYEKPQCITGSRQNAVVGDWDGLGSNGHIAYFKPGKYQFIYLLPVLSLQIGKD